MNQISLNRFLDILHPLIRGYVLLKVRKVEKKLGISLLEEQVKEGNGSLRVNHQERADPSEILIM